MKIKYKFVYTGSFVQGKGIETIIALANHFKEFKFNVFGNLDTISSQNLNKCKSLKNLILNDYQSYFSICKILLKSEYLLLPYEKTSITIPIKIDLFCIFSAILEFNNST